MHSTDHHEAFIVVAADCPVTTGTEPARPGSIAALQHALLRASPYRWTSDDLLFEVHALRAGIEEEEREAARTEFFARPQACLRASPLVKQYGWGLHHDAEGRVAAYGVESEEYRELAARDDLKVVHGMRSRRAQRHR